MKVCLKIFTYFFTPISSWEEVIKKQEGRAQLHDFLFPCASGSGIPLMTVISGRKGKEGAKCLSFFSFFFLRQAREGECLYFWKLTDVATTEGFTD